MHLRSSRGLAILSLVAFASIAPAGALAQTEVYSVLIDGDNNDSTGCTVGSAPEQFLGADYRVITTVDVSVDPPTVTDQDLEVCAAGTWNPWAGPDPFPQSTPPYPAPPVPPDNLLAAVESYVPLSVLTVGGLVQLGFFSGDVADPADVLFTTNGLPGGPPILFGVAIAEIPTLAEWSMLLLSLLLLATGMAALRRRGSRAGVMLGLLLVSLGLGVAAAASPHGADGNILDWTGHTPVATDPSGDGVGTEDLARAFAHGESGNIHFRVDVTRNGPPQAVDDAATVAEDSVDNAILVMANDNDPPPADVFTVGSVTQPANGTVTIAPGGTHVLYTPNANYCNSPPGTTLDTFTYTLQPVPSTATVTVTVTCADDPPTAVDDAATVTEDAAATTIDVRANDTDPDSGPSSIASVTQPASGTVVITNGGADLTYQPAAAYCNDPPGTTPDTFTYTLTPGGSTATVSVTVTCDDDPPTAVDDAATVDEDAPATAVDVLANDTDADGGPKTIASVTQPANGTVVITGGGTGLTYQPAADYCNTPAGSPDTFTYTLAQGGATPTATVSMTVTCLDDAPVANDDTATVAEDAAATAVDVLANDTDTESDPFTIQSVTQPANGTVVITGGGTGLTYQPNADYCNTPPGTTLDTFTYTLTPGGDSATVSMTVTCSDDAPVAVDDSATVNEDSGANAIDVLANDTDVDSGPISIASVTQPANGTVVITGGGTGLTYQPDPAYCNNPPGTTPDTFTYTLTPASATPTATVSVTVTCFDDPPVAVNDSATVNEDSGANTVNVLANDTDTDGGPIAVTSVTQPANGTVVITNAGADLTYAPSANYCNAPPGTTPDTFTYTLTPGGSIATVSVTVTCVNDGPAIDLDANDDKGTGGVDFAVTFTEGNPATLLEDPADATLVDIDSSTVASLTVTLTNLLDLTFEVLDADISAFTGTLTKVYDTTTTPGTGVLIISGTESAANYEAVLRTVTYLNSDTAPDSTARTVTFVANDGTNDGNTATATVTVVGQDTDPTAIDDSATVNEDSGASTIDVLANDTDPDGGPISITSVTQPANGTVVITNSGADLTYAPNPNYCNNPPGTSLDTFTYTLTPGGDSATVTVTVTCIDDTPTAVDDSATVLEDSGANTIDVQANDTDADGGTNTITSVTQPANGTVVITNAGADLTYAPNANYCNSPPGTALDTFTYTLTPGGDSATVTVTVTCVEDNPVAVDDAATVAEDSGATTINVQANDTDADGGTNTITSVTQPANGTVVITNGGADLTYAPNANYCNSPPGTTLDTFTYTLSPGSDSATVTVTVTCVDDPPIAVNDSATVNEDSGANTINVQANDTDPDGGTNTITSVTQPANGTVVITNAGADLTYAPNANYCNNPPGTTLETFTYTLSPASATPTATVTVTVTCINDPPVADADLFDYIGNTELRVDVAASATPHALETTPSTFGVVDGDSDPVEGNAVAVSSITVGSCTDNTGPTFDCTDATVGTVHMQTNGRFSFEPSAGDTGAAPTGCAAGAIDKETFTYVLTDNGTPPASAPAATVTLCRFARVWYVKNDDPVAAPASDNGSSVDPFEVLANAGTASSANDYIFVYFGDGTTADQNAGISLKNGQHLIGEHAGLSIPVDLNGNGSPTVLHAGTPGSRPLLDDTVVDATEGVHALDVIPAEIVGLSLAGNVNGINWQTQAAFAGTGTLSIRDNVVRSAAAEGVDVLLAGTGATNLAFHDNNLTATGTALDVAETGTGSLTITAFHDNVVTGNSAGAGINIVTARFEVTPGGGVEPVPGGTTVIGDSGNGIGGAGMTLTSVTGALNFANLAAGTVLAGDLDIFSDNGGALSVGGGAGGFDFDVTPNAGTLVALSGPAAVISSADVGLQLNSLTSNNSASTGVSLTNVTGTFSAPSGSSITTAGTTDFEISGGTANVTYGGTITDDLGQLVSISGTTAGTKTFSGAITDGDDTDGGGISLSSNTGATIEFTGGVTLSTSANPAFAATGGGTLKVTGTNTAATTTATALNITNTTIHADDVTFRSISSNGGGNPGIVLNNTGSSGGLRVVGNAGSCTSAATCTGGAIQNKTGNGISLDNTSQTLLTRMFIDNNDGSGIGGSTAADLSIDNSHLSNNADTATGTEAAIRFTSLTGTNSISSTTILNSFEDEIRITPSSGTFTLNITSSTIGPNNAATGGNLVSLIGINTAQWTLNVSGGTFTGSRSSAILSNMSNTGKHNVTINGATFTNNGKGISIGSSQSADADFEVTNNTLTGTISNALEFLSSADATTTSVTRGIFESNIIGNASIDSGSRDRNGIAIDLRNNADTTLRIASNNIQHTDLDAILISSADFLPADGGGAQFDLTMVNNIGGEPDDNTVAPVGFSYGMLADFRHTTSNCANITGNNGDGKAAEDLRVRQRDTSIARLERLTDGDGTPNELINSTATVEAHLNAENPLSNPTDVTLVTGFTEAANGACRTWAGFP